MSSGILPYLNAYPVANGADLGGGLAQFNSTFSNPSSLDAYSIRVDQVLNSKINLFGRYSYSPSSLDQRGAVPAPYTVLSTRNVEEASIQTFTLGLSHLITPRISNEVRANYSNDRAGTKYLADSFGAAVPPRDSALFPPGYSPANSQFELFILGTGEFAQGKQATDEQRQINLIDNVSAVKGSHQLKVGGDYRWLFPVQQSGRLPHPICRNLRGGDNLPPTQPCTETPGDALFLTRLTRLLCMLFKNNTLLSHNFSAYGQDTWKVTSRLTTEAYERPSWRLIHRRKGRIWLMNHSP